MVLFTPSKPLRERFLRISGPPRPPKPRFSLEMVDVFEVFTLFSSHRLLDVSSGLLRWIFGSSGRVWGSSWDHFSWPKGTRDIEDPPFLTYMCPSSPPTSQMVPPEPPESPERPQNAPKSTTKCVPKAPNYVSPELLHNHYSFLLLNYSVLLTKYYLLSAKYLFAT